MKTIHALIVVTSTLVACGAEESSTSELCAAMCEYETNCEGNTVCEGCEIDESKLRPEAMSAMTTCFQTLTCSESDDKCFSAGIEASTPRDIDDTFGEACQASVETCGILDDYCIASLLFEAGVVQAAMACFDAACGEIEDCLDSTLL